MKGILVNMRILRVKGKMGRWFEFTLFSMSRTVCIKENAIEAIVPGGRGGTLIYHGNDSYFQVTSSYEEVLKVLTLEERD